MLKTQDLRNNPNDTVDALNDRGHQAVSNSMTPYSRLCSHAFKLALIFPLAVAACSSIHKQEAEVDPKQPAVKKKGSSISLAELKEYFIENIDPAGRLQLAGNESTAVHSKFLTKHKLRIEAGDISSKGAVAMWDEDKNSLVISRDTLEIAAEELHALRLPPSQALQIVSTALLPTMAHEIKHAVIGHQLKTIHQVGFPLGSVDEETLATLDEIAVAGSLEKSSAVNVGELPSSLKDIWAGHLACALKHEREGTSGLFKWVNQDYKNYPSITQMNRRDLLDFVIQFQTSISKEHPRFAEVQDRTERCISVICDPVLYQGLREYFSKRLGLRQKGGE